MSTIDAVIYKQNGSAVKLLVKVPTTASQGQQGLMYVKKIDGYDGMLFDFGEDQFVNMWMKNTFIPLDMLFFDSNHELAYIHENTVPQDETPIGCSKPVRYVLEIDGGRAKTLGIAVGDSLNCSYSDLPLKVYQCEVSALGKVRPDEV